MELLFVRHGETDYNRAHRWQGHSDIPLNALGRKQARALAPLFAARDIDQVVSSDLIRATETARLAIHAGVELRCDPRLREMHFGDCEGLDYTAIVAAGYGDALAQWTSDPLQFAMPGGESYGDLCARVQHWFDDLLASRSGGCVAVFCHGGTVRAFLHAVCGWEQALDWQYQIGNASVTEVQVQAGQAQVVAVGQQPDPLS